MIDESPELHLHSSSETLTSSITELFHRINRVLPDDQKVFSVQGDMLASEALELLRVRGTPSSPL